MIISLFGRCLIRCANSGFPLTDPTTGRQPCITVVETDHGEVVGCVTPHVWKAQRNPYGDMSRGMVFRFEHHFDTGNEELRPRLLPNKREFHSMLCDGHNIAIQSPQGVDFHLNDDVGQGCIKASEEETLREFNVLRMEVWALVKPMAQKQ